MRPNISGMLSRFLPHGVVLLLIGVTMGSVVGFPLALAGFFAVIGAAALLLGFLGGSRALPRIGAAALLLALGILRAIVVVSVHDTALDMFVDRRAAFEGVVLANPDVRGDHANLTVGHLVVAGTATTTLPEHVRVLLIASRYPEFAYGDRIRFSGALEYPEKFETGDGLRTFDYPSYLAKDGVGYLMFRPAVERIGEGGGNALLSVLYRFKSAALEELARAIPEPASGLAAGLVFGEKRSLGDEWSERFRVAGLSHVVVLSGFNMTIVANGLSSFSAALGVGFFGRIVAGAVGIILFALMTGGGATVLRAAIMALLALLARATGKENVFGRALLLAGGAMVAENPRILLADPSFQLSFLASLGLVYGTSLFERRLRLLDRFPKIKETVIMTLATQCFVLPLLLYMTGTLSLFALPANILALPVVPVAMFLAITTAVLGFLSDHLALLASFPAGAVLGWILLVARSVAALPGAEVAVGVFSFHALLLSYGVIAYLCRPRRSPQVHEAPPES